MFCIFYKFNISKVKLKTRGSKIMCHEKYSVLLDMPPHV